MSEPNKVGVAGSPPSVPGQVEKLDQYHEYLQRNYRGGCERFFSPTGFLEKFQRDVEVETMKVRSHVFVRSADEAAEKLRPVVAGDEGVFDLTAEPGSGKTSVLPFRFPTKKVVVALPTPFDAWAAFQMATGECCLRLKGLRLGSSDAGVVYTDSYTAARALLSNYIDYDVLIVDECDSSRGVTKFLAEVRTPGKVLVRMSASYGRTQAGPSKTFRVTESNGLPDVRLDIKATAEYARKNHKGRSLLLVPDADTAIAAAAHIPGSVTICTKSKLAHIASAVLNQKDSMVYVADDTCARGLNLNLDTLFDCQLVAEYGNVRCITPAELYQRKGRVGRNKPGWYHSPGIKPVAKSDSDVDVARNNLVRAVANVFQVGDARLRFDLDEAVSLMDCAEEPYTALVGRRKAESAVVSSPSSGSTTSGSRPASSASKSANGASRTGSVGSPPWLFYYTGSTSKGMPKRDVVDKDSFYVKYKGGHALVKRRTSSSSSKDSSGGRPDSAHESTRNRSGGHLSSIRADLPIAEHAPYAVKSYRQAGSRGVVDLPLSPPVMDLTQLTYDLDWPSLIRDRLVHGGDLPTLVPPASWRHTSVGGVGTDWFRRLDDIAVGDTKFDDSELEVVCRAWNKLVAQSWVRQTPGLSAASTFDRMEYCVRYFQSYFLLSNAE